MDTAKKIVVPVLALAALGLVVLVASKVVTGTAAKASSKLP